jgi:hypothetical protein
MTEARHSIELRVFWFGRATIKVDRVALDHGASVDEMTMFASLKGIVNYTKPRIYSFEGGSDDAAEGRTTWLESLGLQWREVNDNWSLIDKYRSSIQGLIVVDPFQPDTTNLATSIARSKKALIVSPLLAERLTAAPYNLPILVDYRGRFNSKLEVYEELYNNVWPTLTHRAAVSLSPTAQRASLREYAVALGAATFWLDPNDDAEDVLLRKFLASMGAGNVILGWWPQEYAGVLVAAEYGVSTVASDWSSNLTVHSGMPRNINVAPLPKKPALQNKLYVAFILSDGDNLQYTEHLMRRLWDDPNRGKVPMGWTVAPGMVDAMPGALNYYHTTSTVNDALVSGPSGLGYTYPDAWPSISALNSFIAKTEAYNKKAGLNVVTVWNINNGVISDAVGKAYAQYAPSLLGITAQHTDYGLHIYNSKLPSIGLAGDYCSDEACMKSVIADASAGWDGKSPRFILVQAQPWTDISPSSFLSVAKSLNSNYVVVRPDTAFQLIREANGLSWSSPSSAVSSSLVVSSVRSSSSLAMSSSSSSSRAAVSSLSSTSSATVSLASSSIRSVASSSSAVSSVSTSPLAIIEAESYAYMLGVFTEPTTDIGGGLNVGWIDKGDWMAYDNSPVNIPQKGTYTIEFRVASNGGGGVLSFEEAGGLPNYGYVSIGDTGGWQKWVTVKLTTTLEPGIHRFGLKAQQGNFNINKFSITLGAK